MERGDHSVLIDARCMAIPDRRDHGVGGHEIGTIRPLQGGESRHLLQPALREGLHSFRVRCGHAPTPLGDAPGQPSYGIDIVTAALVMNANEVTS